MEMMEMLYPDKILRPGEGGPGTHASMVNIQAFNSKNQLTYDSSRSSLPSSNISKEIVGVDELLANAGYKVRASELAQVAQRLEQLENALGAAQDAGISHLSTDAVHYNPSDLAGWIECMLEELTPTATGNTLHENLYNTDYGMAAGSTSTMGSEISVKSPMSNQHLRPEPVPCTAIAQEFPHEVVEAHLGVHRSGFKDKGLGGIFGGIYSAEQLGLNQEASTKEGPHRFLTDLPSEKHNINPIAGYSASVNEKSFQVNGRSDLIFTNSHEFNQDSIEQSQRQTGPSSQQAAIILDGSDSAQESGIRLVHLLVACAESIQRDDLIAAEKIVREIRVVAGPQSGPMKRVATQFVEALARRIYGLNIQDTIGDQMDSVSELLHFYFALALRPGGPPFLRITGIGPPQAGITGRGSGCKFNLAVTQVGLH
ncbi:hypothetical protein O6H91_02G138400 [Diphasiastrum complanatum]|uniref:Uncharacterized protein n=1 Tax=Diphasiastrum complanatum TaxID=34168 RepID=A0ACC2ELH1_DIPCM|nr:hypothetical protein O6H91_02G138400 [Diphasiastrum complanatum]